MGEHRRKYKGEVKFFNNRHGYGFVTTMEDLDHGDSAPNVTREVFVHFSDIVVSPPGSYRTLVPGTVVEFHIEKDTTNGATNGVDNDSARFKAVNVTAPGGIPLEPTPAKQFEKPQGKGQTTTGSRNSSKRNGGKQSRAGSKQSAEPLPPPFHDVIHDSVKETIVKERGVDLFQKMTVDIAVKDSTVDARIKLGQGAYCGLAQANGVIAEGTYGCNRDGVITFQWEKCLIYSDGDGISKGEWIPRDTESLIPSVSLCDERVGPVQIGETPQTLWGADKPDPRSSFEKHGFQMRKVLLTKPPRRVDSCPSKGQSQQKMSSP